MKVFVSCAVLLFVASVMEANANPLADYKWKNRIIVASMPDGKEQREAAAGLKQKKAGILDRDLIVIDVTPKRMRTSGTIRLSRQATEELRERLSIGDAPVFVLIGKDGGVKSRQSSSLNLEKFFALIDTMPMRKEEMRKNR